MLIRAQIWVVIHFPGLPDLFKIRQEFGAHLLEELR